MRTEVSELQMKLSKVNINSERLTKQYEQAYHDGEEARAKAKGLLERLTEVEEKNVQLQERLSNTQHQITTMDHDNHILQVCGCVKFRFF